MINKHNNDINAGLILDLCSSNQRYPQIIHE